MVKKLTWEETWGKIDWNNVTMEQLEEQVANGANVFMVGKDAKGRFGLPINFLSWASKHDNESFKRYRFLNDCMVKKISPEKNALVEDEIYDLIGKYMYNETEELKKTRWRDLDWKFVTPKVISEMIKKGLDANGSASGEIETYTNRILQSRDPIHLACQAGNINAVRALLKAGADPNADAIVSSGRLKPIDFAKTMEIANCLIQYGAKVSQEQLDEVKEKEEELKPDLEAIRKKIGKFSGLKKLLTLASKEKALDKASKKQREAREDAVAKAEKAGKPLSKEEVKKLRDAEGRARARAYKGMLEQRFGKSGK